MITLSKTGSSIVFEFNDNSTYLNNGTIEVPVNSLALIIDQSDMATFRKSASNDIFVSANIAEFGMTKAELEEWYAENMVGSTGGSGSGLTPEQAQTMIDESISGKADTTAVTAVNDVLTAHTANTNIHVTSEEKTAWNAKSDFSGSYNDLTDKPTIPTVPTDVSAFNNDAGYITADSISGKADVSAITAIESAMTEDEEVTAAALNNLQENKADTTAVTAVNNVLTAHTADTTIHVTSSDKSTWSGKQDALVSGTNIKTINNESILGSGNITISGGSGGNANIVEVTQAEYDALVSGGTVDPDAMYVITDATEVNVSGFVQTSAITTAVTSASTNSEIPSALAVYAATSGGGGSITIDPSLDTGSTNAVANSAITTAINNKADKSAAFGNYGFGNISGVDYLQFKNVSNTNVGNGLYYPIINNIGILTTNAAYAKNNFNFQLVETSAVTTSITSASTDSQIASAKCVYDQLGGLKFVQITQSDYDLLPTKDSSTVYIIVN